MTRWNKTKPGLDKGAGFFYETLKSLTVLTLVMIGFILHKGLHLESATVALAGAALLMLIARDNEPEDVLLTVEWPTIFFFIGLFVLVGSLERVGIIETIARETLNLTHGNQTITAMTILITKIDFTH